jgi:phosphatidylglycerophosphate synthase
VSFRFVTQPDNAVQVVFRFASTLIVRVLCRTPVTPNQVTIARSAVVLASLYYFSLGDPRSLLIAVSLFYFFEILDHVDGDLARTTKKFSKLGPLLEQFIDTWASRLSNVFGFCVALGMYNFTGSITGFALFAVTAFGRLQWLEYRDVFGWIRTPKEQARGYTSIFSSNSAKEVLRNLFVVTYTWNNTFILIGALLYGPAKAFLHIDTMVLGFSAVALINNLPWIAITASGFRRAIREDH